MFRTKEGYWKSDFKIKLNRYQKKWKTTNKREALVSENKWKRMIRASPHLKYNKLTNIYNEPTEMITSIKTMSFEEVGEYMDKVKWQYLRDYRNPPNRWKYISKFFGVNKPISKLTIDDLDRFKEYLISKQYANKTVNHYLSDLKIATELIEIKQKVIFENKLSFEGLRMSVTNGRKVCFSKKEEELMYKTLCQMYKESTTKKNWEMLQYFIINSGLGLRPAEYIYLEIGDIDFENKTITISRGGYNSTKNDLIRTLPLEGIVLKSMKLLIKYALSQNKTIDIINNYNIEDISDIKLIEITSIKEVKNIRINTLTKDTIINRWNKMKIILGWTDKYIYKEYIPYGLRHTVASRLAGQHKWNGYRIMRFMGHKSYHTSLNYIHLDVEDLREGACISNQDLTLITFQ